MISDLIATHASNRLPIADIHAYHRSKLFTVQTSVNPLIAAASALLALGPQLRATESYQDIQALHQHLVHEVKAFETNAQNQGYRSEAILVARYVLCTFLDEAILCTPWGAEGDWELYKLLWTFQKETWGGDRFFLILERSSEDPGLHIELLELMYLCLSLGFEGKYHSLEDGRVQLAAVTEQLYQTIRWHRGELKKQLLIEAKLSQPVSAPIKKESVPIWMIITLTATLLFTFYAGSHYFISKQTATLYKAL